MVSLKITLVVALAIIAFNVNAFRIDRREGVQATDNCESFEEHFSADTDLNTHWEKFNNASTYTLSPSGLEMKILNPGSDSKLGMGSLFSSKKLVQYGRIEAKMKSAPVGGLVTAFIFMSPNGDEIDWEWIGPEVQTAYYYKGIPDFSTSDAKHLIDQSNVYHTYTIDWQPDSITWYIDNKLHRTVKKSDTQKDGEHHFPQEASHVELGLWDASGSKTTAEWAHGPINWSAHPNHVSAFVEYVKVTCYGG